MTGTPPSASSVGQPGAPGVGGANLYELRQYRVASGRLQEEIDRAMTCILPPETGGMGLFARHGIPEPIGMWRALTGSSLPCVVFLYQWPDAASRAQAFESFYEDHEWRRERARTNDGSEIVDRLDDLLLTGPSIPALPDDMIYAFSFARAAEEPPNLIATLSPLCGDQVNPLRITTHSSMEEALAASGDEGPMPLLCERIAMRVP